MSPRFLNIIIAASMLGMLLIVVKEKYYPRLPSLIESGSGTGGQAQTPQSSQINAVTATKTDPEIPCANEYFNFQKGTAWKYKLSTGALFTSTVASNSASLVTINTTLPPSKEPTTSTLTCRKSGVYGLPFFPITSKSIPQSLVDSILLIPNGKELTNGQSWTSTIDLGIQIPFLSSNGVTIKSTVEKATNQSATIASTLDLGSLPANLSPIGNGKILEYTLTKGIGISSLKLLVGKDGKTSSGFIVSLAHFSASQ